MEDNEKGIPIWVIPFLLLALNPEAKRILRELDQLLDELKKEIRESLDKLASKRDNNREGKDR
ncbi:MAG: hypothetical protein OEW69_08470 [Nitrospirota bacterium]|nr:hypothetical protein [Nitrospirota bacterium]